MKSLPAPLVLFLIIMISGAEVRAAAPDSGEDAGAAAGEIEQLLRRAARSVTSLQEPLAVVVAREEYTQTAMQGGDWRTIRERALVSDVAWVPVELESNWVFFRDVFSVDGQPVRDRTARLEKLFSGGPTLAAREQGARIRAESARYNLGPQRTVNDPAVALWFLHRRNQGRFRFRLIGPSKVEGVAAVRLDFTEANRPTLIRTSQGLDLPARGALWIEATGASLVFSRLDLDVPGLGLTQIRVAYRQQPAVDAWLPTEMREAYAVPETSERLEAVAKYSRYRKAHVEVQEIRPAP